MNAIRNSFVYLSAILITLRYGFTVYLLYPIIFVFSWKYKINKTVFIYLLLVMLFFLFKSFSEDSIFVSIESLKYYFGFTLFLLIFHSSSNRINNNLLLLFILLIISIAVEYLIINYHLLPREYWFNVAHADGSLLHPQTEGQMRPYGIGKNATMTATLVTVLYVHLMTEINSRYINSFKAKIILTLLFIATIVLLRSGLGFFISMLAIFFVVANSLKKKIIYSFVFFIVFVVVFYIIESNLDDFSRFSLSYVDYLIGFKANQIFVTLLLENYGAIEFLFGATNQTGFSNDIGWIPFFYNTGVYGLLLYAFIITKSINRYNSKSLFILLLSAWHYPAIFSIPGQILFAYLLSKRKSNI